MVDCQASPFTGPSTRFAGPTNHCENNGATNAFASHPSREPPKVRKRKRRKEGVTSPSKRAIFADCIKGSEAAPGSSSCIVESAISSNVGFAGGGGAWAGVIVASLLAIARMKNRSRALSTRGGAGGRGGGGGGGDGEEGGLLPTTGTTMQNPRWGRRRVRKRRTGGSIFLSRGIWPVERRKGCVNTIENVVKLSTYKERAAWHQTHDHTKALFLRIMMQLEPWIASQNAHATHSHSPPTPTQARARRPD
jgi:hypothetical protein